MISLPTLSQEAYQKVVVEATVLKVMHESGEVHSQHLILCQRLTRNNSPMTHQHVSHLHDRRYMYAAAHTKVGVFGISGSM